MFLIECCCRTEFRRYAFVPLLFVFAFPAQGMVYSWTDSAGVAHYTNKEYEIPTRYRAKVKARYPEQGDTAVSAAPPQIVQQNSQTIVKELPSAVVLKEKPGVPSTKVAPTVIAPQSSGLGPRKKVRLRTGPVE